MVQKQIKPGRWQEPLGFSQGIELSGAGRVLACAGPLATDAEGKLIHDGDMRAQINSALDNLEAVLKRAGYDLPNVVRLNYYTTDVDGFFAAYDAVTSQLKGAGCQPASTLLGVARLPLPGTTRRDRSDSCPIKF
jgi:enamine deaminase RidA (YjgF/YER057c/UK114 family)